MKNIRLYAWMEFVIWLIILAVLIFGVKIHNKNYHKKFKNYQIFISDADGLIVGSPVRYSGVQIGYVTKIQIISSNVYIRFVVTEKDFDLPEGVTATVEGSGLAGSKAIEIYPPELNNPSDKLINTKDPVRLSQVMSLFKNIFKELDAIITSISAASRKIREDKSVIEQIDELEVKRTEVHVDLETLDKKLDSANDKAKKLEEVLKKLKGIRNESRKN